MGEHLEHLVRLRGHRQDPDLRPAGRHRAAALFAIGVRLGESADGPTEHRRELTLLRWIVFALLLAAVLVGVLFIARDFIEHRIGWQWDDWGNWDEVFGLE